MYNLYSILINLKSFPLRRGYSLGFSKKSIGRKVNRNRRVIIIGINFIRILNLRIRYLIVNNSINIYSVYSGKIIFLLITLIKIQYFFI